MNFSLKYIKGLLQKGGIGFDSVFNKSGFILRIAACKSRVKFGIFYSQSRASTNKSKWTQSSTESTAKPVPTSYIPALSKES